MQAGQLSGNAVFSGKALTVVYQDFGGELSDRRQAGRWLLSCSFTPAFLHFAAANAGRALSTSQVAQPVQIAIPAERTSTKPEKKIQLI
jgi:hypothetical protein